jgi:hypothetical protein
MMKKWTYDVALGVAICHDTESLRIGARIVAGLEVQEWWAFNYTALLEDAGKDIQLVTALECQLRWLYRMFPAVEPSLRAAIPTNYGQSRILWWYDKAYEQAGLVGGVVTNWKQVKYAAPTPATFHVRAAAPSVSESWRACPMEYRSGKHTCCPACNGTGRVRA